MVDNSGDSSKGDVYVVDQGHNFLDEFNAKGEIQEGFGTKGQVELAGAQPTRARSTITPGGSGRCVCGG